MQLVLAIVQDQDAEALISDLIGAGHRATRMAATGGFLRRGNHLVVVGVQEDAVDEVVGIIRGCCRTRRYPSRATAVPIPSDLPPPAGHPVTVGGATIFVLNQAREAAVP